MRSRRDSGRLERREIGTPRFPSRQDWSSSARSYTSTLTCATYTLHHTDRPPPRHQVLHRQDTHPKLQGYTRRNEHDSRGLALCWVWSPAPGTSQMFLPRRVRSNIQLCRDERRRGVWVGLGPTQDIDHLQQYSLGVTPIMISYPQIEPISNSPFR